jgi:hypothetical protein
MTEREWQQLVMRADSMLSLLRHRGGIHFGTTGLPQEWEVDRVIGALRRASETEELTVELIRQIVAQPETEGDQALAKLNAIRRVLG